MSHRSIDRSPLQKGMPALHAPQPARTTKAPAAKPTPGFCKIANAVSMALLVDLERGRQSFSERCRSRSPDHRECKLDPQRQKGALQVTVRRLKGRGRSGHGPPGADGRKKVAPYILSVFRHLVM